jgi:transposase-like protein
MSRVFPSVQTLQTIFSDAQICLEYLKTNGCLDIPEQCPKCQGPVSHHGHFWKCKKPGCRKQESFFKGSFFAQTRLPCSKILEIGYYWLAGCRRNMIVDITGHSSATVTAYMKFYRQLVESSLDEDDTIIGGEGVEVQVDESKFGKRKYERGHRVEGAWVIGGVELTQERKMFAKMVEKRDQGTIRDVLRAHIAPGSVLVTDCWRGYIGVEEALNLRHLTVNHSKTFKDPETGACSNNIEGTWSGMKGKIPLRNRTQSSIKGHLLEFIWRRKNNADLWKGLIASLQKVGY